MIYNAEGQILKPFVAHKGQIPKAVQEYFAPKFGFLCTEDGEFDQTCLMEIGNYIER